MASLYVASVIEGLRVGALIFCYGLSLDKETRYSFVHFESLLHVKFQRAFTSNIKAKVTARSTEYL